MSMLQLVSKIADNHHRSPIFFNKLNKIIYFLIVEMQPHITDFEIYQIFKNNKCILLLLLEQELIQPDTRIITDIMTKHDQNHFPYRHYLYPVIKSFLNEKESEAIEKEIIRK